MTYVSEQRNQEEVMEKAKLNIMDSYADFESNINYI